jgi:hypothetical protein
MGLLINEEKTKVMLITSTTAGRTRLGQNLTIGDYNFEVVNQLTYLGAIVTNDSENETEIKKRIVSANRCYFSLSKLMKSKRITRTTKIRLSKTLIIPILTYGSETWTLTKNSEELLERFERKVIREIFGAIEENGEWRRRYNRELYLLYNDIRVVQRIKIERLRLFGHVFKQNENETTIRMLQK